MSPTGNNWTHRGLWFCILTITIYLITTINILYRWKNKPIITLCLSNNITRSFQYLHCLYQCTTFNGTSAVGEFICSLSVFYLYEYRMFIFQAYPTQQSRIGAATIYYTLKSSMQSTTILYYFGSSPNYYYGTQLLLLQSALNIYQTGQLMSNNHEEMTTMTSSHQPVTD